MRTLPPPGTFPGQPIYVDPVYYVALVSVFALILYLITTINVGRARARYKIEPPATSGNADFERYYRVQMNTMEQLIVFLPALWMFAALWKTTALAAIIGGIWLVARVAYAVGYYKSAAGRIPGFIVSMLCTVTLVLDSLAGILKVIL